MWDVLDRALANLEANHDITLTTARPYVIGHLCPALEQLDGREAAAIVARLAAIQQVLFAQRAAPRAMTARMGILVTGSIGSCTRR